MLGNKARYLQKLKESFGDLIPDFFVLNGEDYFSLDFPSDIKLELNADNVDEVSKSIISYVEQTYRANVIERIRNEIQIDWTDSAVRSSSSLEDGSSNSFAGQFSTFLNVEKEDVPARIWDCFMSLFHENVLHYLVKNNLSFSALSMSVIVQRMVQADKAGVLFGVNPQGLLNEVVITVDEGLGEIVVGGKSIPTSYYYNVTDKLYYYEGTKDLLTREQIEELINLALKAKTSLDISYPDMEFAIKDDKIYILQVRPITTLKFNQDCQAVVFDNSNIVESYPGISLPLTCSFVNLVYGGVFKDITIRVLKNDNVIKDLDQVFYNMVGNANGRLYYKIANWYTILLLLPFNKKIIPVWQEMLGVQSNDFSKLGVQMNSFQRMKSHLNYILEIVNVTKNMNKLNSEFESVKAYFDNAFSEGLSNEQLLSIFDTLRVRLFSCWGVTLVNDIYAFVFTGLVKSRLAKKYHLESEAINKYISGISNIESLKPIRNLIDLCFEKASITETEYKSRFDQYIREYGDRNLEELKLESRTFRTTPSLLEEKVAEYTKDLNALSGLHEKFHSSERESNQAWNDVVTRFLMKRCNEGIANREVSRLNRSRIYGFVRSIVESIGRNLEQSGIIDHALDIHYLTLAEIYHITNVNASLPVSLLGTDDLSHHSAREIVSIRKAEYDIYRALPAYSRLIFAEHEFNKAHSSVNSHAFKQNASVIHGTPCSSGVVTAEALVVEDVTSVKEVAGRILVTRMTDPGWVFLLTSAGGVISEKGSLLSHTAIISRELGIPSIVGVPGVMNMISTGDLLKLDGNNGVVEILKRA